MKQFRIIILLIATSMLLYACPEKDGQKYLYVKNVSDKSISFQEKINTSDTSFYCTDIGTLILPTVLPNSVYALKVDEYTDGWDRFVKTFSLIIVDGELYEKYWQQPCDTIRKYVPILYRYQLTLEDLQRMNWTVVYPPEDE